jgi:hypothetical protein
MLLTPAVLQHVFAGGLMFHHLKVGTILVVANRPAGQHLLLLLSAAVPLDFMTGTILTILHTSCWYFWLFTNTFFKFSKLVSAIILVLPAV